MSKKSFISNVYKHSFNTIDYNNITYNDLVKIKLDAISIIDNINRWNKSDVDTSVSEFDNFLIVTNSVYGMMSNPYKDVLYNIYKMFRLMKIITEKLNEQWMLNSISFVNKKQKFNKTIFLGMNTSLEDMLNIIDNYDKSLVLYDEAYINKNITIKKYIGYDKNTDKNIFIEHTDNTVIKIYSKDSYLVLKTYHIDRSWNVKVSTSKEYFEHYDSKHLYIWKQMYPENFLIQ